MRRYFLSTSPQISKLSTFKSHGSIFNWRAFSIEEIEIENLKTLIPRFIEIEEEVAVLGFKSFGDPREEIKVYAVDIDLDQKFEDIDIRSYIPEGKELTSLDKVKIPFTEIRKNIVIKTMKLIAKLIIEDEYDRKYEEFISKTSLLERATWDYQISDDNFISSLSEIKNKEVEQFSSVVKENNLNYKEITQLLYLDCQKLKQKFYDCTSIKELNILYEDYFNVPMHSHQALEIGREILNADSPNQRQDVGRGYGLNF